MKEENNIKEGYFRLARQVFKSEIWERKPATWMKIWLYILGNVSHKKTSNLDVGEGFFNFACDRKSIGIDVKKDVIKKFIRWSKVSTMISTRRSTRGVYIKVLNYAKYQDGEKYKAPVEAPVEAPEKHRRSTPINKNYRIKEIHTSDFDFFWTAYAKKIDRPKCEAKWKKLTAEDREAIISYIPKYLASISDKQYQKHPATFLNNRSWENDLATPPTAAAPPMSEFDVLSAVCDLQHKYSPGEKYSDEDTELEAKLKERLNSLR